MDSSVQKTSMSKMNVLKCNYQSHQRKVASHVLIMTWTLHSKAS
ncbi:unnamed protein product [Amoebophrya sp. A25]|nr:unnamed protein product [Amoebophrya sp. A25]|eukprot:GSA25T00012956001.1